MLQTLSDWQGIGVLNADCAVRPSYSNDASIAEAEIAMNSCFRSLSTDCIERMVNVFPIPQGVSRKYARGRRE